MRAAVLVLFVAACSVPESEPCEAPERVSIPLPDRCVEDASCTVDTAADEACGRAYVCSIEDGAPECIVARDCDCLAAYEDACGETYVPAYCETK
jgi:hypothetical protein